MSSEAIAALRRLGGVAHRRDLVAATSRACVDETLRTSEIEVVARGVYRLRGADRARTAARVLHGTVSHLSAALHWGWAVKTVPDQPEITVARHRTLSLEQRSLARIARADLLVDEHRDRVTSQERTLVDCLRREDFDSGLAVADSALRAGFAPQRLADIARDARGPRSRQVREVVARANGDAANPFESVLRAIAEGVPGLSLRPQVPIFGPDFLGRPDLVDQELRIIAEADSFEWHGGRSDLRRDARRYDEFVVAGWLVLRFAWEDVMFDPLWVRSVLTRAVRVRTTEAS